MIRFSVDTKTYQMFEDKKDNTFEHEFDNLKEWLSEQGKPCLILNTGKTGKKGNRNVKTFIPLENVDFITIEECDE